MIKVTIKELVATRSLGGKKKHLEGIRFKKQVKVREYRLSPARRIGPGNYRNFGWSLGLKKKKINKTWDYV